MKALTIRQPWASLIALDAKTIETRSWRTDYRGPLAIHAGTSLPVGRYRGDVVRVGEYAVQRDAAGLLLRSPRLSWPYRLPLGAVVATCTLADCLPILPPVPLPNMADRWVAEAGNGKVIANRGGTAGDGWAITTEAAYGDYTPGRWAWILGDVTPCAPVPAKGRQGLWEWQP